VPRSAMTGRPGSPPILSGVTRRALAVAIAVVAALGGLFATSSTAESPTGESGAVVVIATGGISWSDVSKEATPNLWTLLRDGSSAALSVRSVYANTCPIDGWLGLSAGARAAAPRTGEAAAPVDRPCPRPPSVVEDHIAEWSEYQAAAAATRYDSRLGLLGGELDTNELCVRAVGPYAAAGAATPDGTVERWSDLSSEQLVTDLNTCPVTLVDVGSVRDPEDVAEGEMTSGTRAEQVTEIDTRIGQVLEAGPNGADFLVASISDAGRSERLRLVVARGPHFGPGTLVSGSTRQDGLAQSPDLTATVLSRVGLEVPPAVDGAPLTTDPAPDNSEPRAETRLTDLRDYDEASHDVHGLVEPFFQVLAYGQIAIYLFVLLVLKGRLGSDTSRVTALSRVRVVAVVAAAVPVSTFLANLLPWWRFPVAMLSVVAAVGLFVAVIAVVALRPPLGRLTLGPMVTVSAVTFVVLAADVITGSRLQLSSLMGLQPVVGGRFYGMGNPTFALFATATLLLATGISSWLVAADRRREAALAVVVIGGVAVVIDAAPFWGADGGGPPALVPGLAYLGFAVLGLPMTWRRWLAVAGGVVGLAVVVAVLDWLRAPSSRTHLGRFVQSVIDGQAGEIVTRKAEQNWELFLLNFPLTLLIPVGLLFLTFVLARPTSWGSRVLARSYDRAPTLKPGLVALLITMTIGFLVNDSGVAIPAVGATLAVPLIVSVCAASLLEEARATAGTRAARRWR
jgi:hypothetical protein